MVVVAVVDVGDDEDDDGYDDVVVGYTPSYARRPFDTTLGDGFFPVLNTPRCKTCGFPLAWPLLLFQRQKHSDGASVMKIATIAKLDRPNLIKR